MKAAPLIDVAKDAKITYRQADHWVRRGFLDVYYAEKKAGKPGKRVGASGRMSGRIAMLTPYQQRVLLVMAPLVRAGFEPAAASKVARRMVRNGKPTMALAPGVHLTVGEVA